jgi:hypothetical protein
MVHAHAPLLDNRCVICGLPADAEVFDVSGYIGRLPDPERQNPPSIPLPQIGEQTVLATFQLHNQYCGAITYFAQYTDLYARDHAQIQTPGFEWQILQNGKPVFPYTSLEMIINPWGCNCLPVFIRLDENARVEFVIRNRTVSNPGSYPIRAFAGRIMGRYWYNDVFGRRVR